MRNVQLYWDPDREIFMDEGGYEWQPYDLGEYLPNWILELTRVYRSRGEEYLCYTWHGALVEIFWPSEEVNWYL